jgi:hypothetical protein
MAIKSHTALAEKYQMSEMDIAKLAKKMPKRKIGYVRLEKIGFYKNRIMGRWKTHLHLY